MNQPRKWGWGKKGKKGWFPHVWWCSYDSEGAEIAKNDCIIPFDFIRYLIEKWLLWCSNWITDYIGTMFSKERKNYKFQAAFRIVVDPAPSRSPAAPMSQAVRDLWSLNFSLRSFKFVINLCSFLCLSWTQFCDLGTWPFFLVHLRFLKILKAGDRLALRRVKSELSVGYFLDRMWLRARSLSL